LQFLFASSLSGNVIVSQISFIGKVGAERKPAWPNQKHRHDGSRSAASHHFNGRDRNSTPLSLVDEFLQRVL
jgi:hypothetical protein